MAFKRALAFSTLTLVVFACSFCDAAKPGGGGTSGMTFRVVPVSSSAGIVRSINDSSQTVGYLSDPPLAQYWHVGSNDAVSTLTLDHTLSDPQGAVEFDSVANSINNQGMIVGAVGDYATGTNWRPVVWMDATMPVQPLPIPEGLTITGGEAFGISHQAPQLSGLQAVIVGRLSHDEAGRTLCFVVAWPILTSGEILTPTLVDFGTTGEFNSAATSINSQLTVVGAVDQQAMRWQLNWNGTSLGVAAAQPLYGPGSFSTAEAVNEFGDICGTAGGQAFLLENVNGSLTNRTLALLVNNTKTGTRNVRAYALDSSATPKVVGAVDVYRKSNGVIDRLNDPVLWQGSSVTDLMKVSTPTTLVPDDLTAINNSGRIAGTAWTGTLHVPVVLIPQ